MAVRLYAAPTNAATNAIVDTLNSGFIQIRTGSQPAIEGALTGTLLATVSLAATAFGDAVASGGLSTATAGTITGDSAADATGTAGYFAVLASNGTTVEFTGTVTATGGGGDMTLVTTSITTGQPVTISSFTFSLDQDLGA
jgi:hypothetical protein